MTIIDWYKDSQYIPCQITKLSEAEATYYLREAWKSIYNVYPKNSSLALLFAQWCLETSRGKSLRCWNYGNIKKTHGNSVTGVKDDGCCFTMFRLNEILKGKEEWFDPPHIQTHMRGFKTPLEGAIDYIKFLSQRKRYLKAWQEVINGRPREYAIELHLANYYTASVELYTKGIVRLTDEFNRKSAILLSWHPAQPIPPQEKHEEIFTEEERKEIMAGVTIGIDNSIHDYFKMPRYDLNDEHDYFKVVEKKSIWDSLKGIFIK